MGELADRLKYHLDDIRRKPALLGRDLFIDAETKILDDVAELEAKLASLEAELLYGPRRQRMAYGQIEIDNANRDRDAALAAVTELIGRGADIVFLDRVVEVRDVLTVGTDRTALIGESDLTQLETDARIALDARPGWHVAIIAPSNKFNPELLERASTLLMEQYIDAKAKEPK